MAEPLWLFGYGSIIWKTGFDYDSARLAYVTNRARRFWQASTDHRGTIDAPGRVVTLVEQTGENCWGMAYRIPAEAVEKTLIALDHREVGGYVREAVTISFADGSSIEGLTYNARADNPNFLGEAGIDEIAKQIASSHGPSGSNKEYILELAKALTDHEVEDDHVHHLARKVQELTDDNA